MPSSLTGFVYIDLKNDGKRDPGDPGIAGVVIHLTGTDDLGAAVNEQTITSAAGSYLFVDCGPAPTR